jgi:uncharacterized protein YunC (DUF1805 family)
MDLNAFESHHVQLHQPLLILKGSKGLLGCGYLNIETFDKTGEAAAIVSGVATFDDMASAVVAKVSRTAQELGLRVGMTGAQALELIR